MGVLVASSDDSDRAHITSCSSMMMPFSTRIELERAGITRPELELSLGRSTGSGRWTPLQKQERQRIGGGSPIAAPMPKSVLSCGREYQLLRE